MPAGRSDLPPPFLPAMPAPRAARALSWILIGLFAAAVVAVIVIRVPEKVTTRFVLVPAQGADEVRAPRDGTIAQVSVAETQTVGRGQAMFVIHSTQVGDRAAELRSLETQLQGAAERLANERRRYESQRAGDDDEETRQRGRLAHLTQRSEEQRALRESRQARYRATLAIYENEMEITRREIDFRHKQHELARELAERTARLHREGIISWLENNTRQLEASKLAVDLEQLAKQVDTGRLKVTQLTSEEQQREIEWKLEGDQLQTERKATQGAIDKLRHEAAARRSAFVELERGLREETDKAQIRTAALRRQLERTSGNELTVVAPCAGPVLRLAVQRAGAVVREGETLCELACSGERLQAQLTLPSSGVGHVKPGQPVKLLYDTFPYQRYGVRHATVRWVSPAAVGDQFRVFADITDAAITVKGEARALTAGMGGRADVIVGRRRLAAYAFEPVRQLRESLADVPAGEVKGPR
jgi:hemolysin D